MPLFVTLALQRAGLLHTKYPFEHFLVHIYLAVVHNSHTFALEFLIIHTKSMKKLILMAAIAASSMTAFAGGLLTNTNQNAAFLRQMSQDATIDITSIYANPAGLAFLSDGWHLSINSQSAFQQRNITTTFPLFAFNAANPGQTTHEFQGKAKAPVIPSVSASWNHGKWSVSGHFALGGGGGKCNFEQGLGSFEALVGGKIAGGIISQIGQGYAAQAGPQMIPSLMGQQNMSLEEAQAYVANAAQEYAIGAFQANPTSYLQGYSLNSSMKGTSYYFGLQLGATYKFNERVSGFVGLRGVYATCNYDGYVKDINYGTAAGYASTPDITLNCDQKGFGITPIIGLDVRVNKHWNFGAKYELKTRIRLKNSSDLSPAAQQMAADPTSALANYADGKKVAEDIPGLLTIGAQYSPCSKVRINAAFHEFFDKSATKTGHQRNRLTDTLPWEGLTTDHIAHNTWEVNAGIEWDINKYVTISGSWQRTCYGLSDQYMSDMSFNLSNHMIGAGVRINPCDLLSIDLGYMHTFYQSRDVVSMTAVGPKTDHYVRKNDVLGVGVNFKF